MTINVILGDQATRRGVSISVVLLVISQLCGVLAILNYTASIFAEAGISLDPNYAACIVAGLQFIGSYLSTVLTERLGRKVCSCYTFPLISQCKMFQISYFQLLISVSSFGSGAFLVLMGAHDYCKNGLSIDMTAYSWIPLLSLSGVCFISATGMTSLPYVVSAEVLPEKIRGAVIGNGSILQWLISFVYFQHFNWLISVFNMYGAMWIFGLICWAYTAFTIIVVPETKGRSLDEIRNNLGSTKV